MADDLLTMKARISDEMARGSSTLLTTAIAQCINDAILIYQSDRFRFNKTVPSAPITFNTVIGQANYGVAANANIGTLFDIDYVLIQIGNMLWYCDRSSPKDLKIYNQLGTMMGQPTWYAYEGNEIILSPIPTAVYPVTLGLFKRVAAPATDTEVGNPWMTDAERLIRARAKFEIATHYFRNPTMAVAMSPSPPSENGGVVGAAWREWGALKTEANRVVSLGRIKAMQF